MTHYPYILFNKSPEELRLLGARGGRAQARNQRARRSRMQTAEPAAPVPAVPTETTAQAIAALDAHFPWLRGAEKRFTATSVSVPSVNTPKPAQLSRRFPRRG